MFSLPIMQCQDMDRERKETETEKERKNERPYTEIVISATIRLASIRYNSFILYKKAINHYFFFKKDVNCFFLVQKIKD